MSEYNLLEKKRQNYVVASEKGFELLERETLIEPEVLTEAH